MAVKPLILDGRLERELLPGPFNTPRITPKVGDVYRVTAQIAVGKGKTVRAGVMGQVTALEENGGLTIELPYTRTSGANADDAHSFESGIDTFTLKQREWQRNGQIVLGGLDSRITPTPSEVAPPAGPFVAAIPPRQKRIEDRPEIAGHPTRNRRKLG